MSNINNQTKDLFALDTVQELSHETAAAVTGGAGVAEVILWDQKVNQGRPFETNDQIPDLRKVNFDNKASFVQVNNIKSWAFYDLPNFQGKKEIVRGEGSRRLVKLNNKVSSLRAIN